MAAAGSGNIEFWVSADAGPSGDGSRQTPFDTIEGAQAAVRAVLRSAAPLTGDILVHVGGTHRLSRPLFFAAEDSGRDGHVVRYRGLDGALPIVSGGSPVTGWSRVDDPGIALAPGAALWEARVDPASGSRQLYVDGVRATRAETNYEDVYPLGFRPTYYDLPGISGIEYVVDPRNGANWRDPSRWTNVNDIEAVVYTQWKMISVPLKAVRAPSAEIPSLNPAGAPLVGLIELLDPAWTNANLIRGLPSGTATSEPGVIALHGALAAQQVRTGMTVTPLSALGDLFPGEVIQVDRDLNQIRVTYQSWLPGISATLSIREGESREQVLGQPNMWSFWRVTKFVNAYQFLSNPNDWYLDRAAGKLYLVADGGDDPNRHDIQRPVLDALIQGAGASNLAFEGLCFEYAGWFGPSRVTGDAECGLSADGYVSDQAGFHIVGTGHETNLIGHFQTVTRTPGNISFGDAAGIIFADNVVRHMGGVALDFSGGAQNNRISRNRFYDISSTAVQIGGVNAEDARPGSDSGVTRGNCVDGNFIENVGVEYIDTPAILLGYSRDGSIDGNFISGTPWAAISVGWGWGLRDRWIAADPETGEPVDMGSFPGVPGAWPGLWGRNDTPTIMGGNQVVGNRITRFLQKAWDGGAVYTTGFQDGDPADPDSRGTLIARNYAYAKTPGSGSNVFYTDGGSRSLELSGNIAFGNPTGCFNFGPPFNAGDALNADNPLAFLPLSNSLPYGSDIGGCNTFGDIVYKGNRWESWWSENPFFPVNPTDFPDNPLYYDPGGRGTQSDPGQDIYPLPGAPYPTNLELQSNIRIGGLDPPCPGVAVDDVLAFLWPTSVSAARVDGLGGEVDFGLQSLDDGAVTILLEQGGAPSASREIHEGVWLPVAMLDGVPLILDSLQTDGGSSVATFLGGYQCRFLWTSARSD